MMWRSPRPRLWEEVKVKYKKKYLPHPWVSSVFLPTSHLSKLRKPQVLHTSSYFTYRQWLRFTKKKKKGCLPPPSCHSLVLLAFLCGRWPPSLCCGSLAPRPPHPSLHFHCGSYSRAYDTKTLKQMNTLLLCYTTLLKSSVFAKIFNLQILQMTCRGRSRKFAVITEKFGFSCPCSGSRVSCSNLSPSPNDLIG